MAYAPLYSTDEHGVFVKHDKDEAYPNAYSSERYWKLKNGGAITIDTGFRIWANDFTEVTVESDPVSFEYTFQELGFIDPTTPPDTTWDDDGTGKGIRHWHSGVHKHSREFDPSLVGCPPHICAEGGASALLTATAAALATILVL